VGPDAHDGTAEKYIAAGLILVAIVLLALARVERRRWKTAAAK
jgi:hypothetical protein